MLGVYILILIFEEYWMFFFYFSLARGVVRRLIRKFDMCFWIWGDISDYCLRYYGRWFRYERLSEVIYEGRVKVKFVFLLFGNNV